MRTPLCDELGIEFPIFAFTHCRDVVAAVSKAGGFGVLGAVGFTPEQLEVELAVDRRARRRQALRRRHRHPRQVRGHGRHGSGAPRRAAPRHGAQGARGVRRQDPRRPRRARAPRGGERAHAPARLDRGHRHAADRGGARPPEGAAHRQRARHPARRTSSTTSTTPGLKVAALCGSPYQALKHKDAGVDIVIAQGGEGGGHTGDVGSIVLWPQVAKAIAPTPMLAAGGIGSGQQIAAALALGAQGVWAGSLWLTVEEADLPPAQKQQLLDAGSRDTVRSRSFTGKPCRMLKSDWTEAWDAPDTPDPLPMPMQYMVSGNCVARGHRYADKAQAVQFNPVGQVVGQLNNGGEDRGGDPAPRRGVPRRRRRAQRAPGRLARCRGRPLGRPPRHGRGTVHAVANEGSRIGLVLGAGAWRAARSTRACSRPSRRRPAGTLAGAAVVVGTSAGSLAGAGLRAGLSVADMLARAEDRPLSAGGSAPPAGVGTASADVTAAAQPRDQPPQPAPGHPRPAPPRAPSPPAPGPSSRPCSPRGP